MSVIESGPTPEIGPAEFGEGGAPIYGPVDVYSEDLTSYWNIRLFDRNGNAVNANYSGYSDSGTTNEIVHATDRRLNFYLNAVDECEFSLYLDDPMAANINRLTRFVKVWRSVPGYSDSSNQPVFAGIVGQTSKNGEQNIMRVKCFSPFWRLQFRFHLLNHYLKTNNNPGYGTGAEYRQSELIWKLIDLINNAFGLAVSFTGIDRGTFIDLASEVIIAPYFQPKGANTWAEIFDELLLRPGSVDLIPRYHHTAGNPTLMFMDTALKRGYVRPTTFTYRTATPSNCTDMIEEELVIPSAGQNGDGGFANYVWAVGAGGPNSGKIAVTQNASGSGEGYGAIGIYMKRIDMPNIKRIGVLSDPITNKPTHLRAIADAELKKSIVPQKTYAVTLSPVANIFYSKDFTVGDIVTLNGSRGAMSVNASQRIYQCSLSISDNNFETASPLLSKDFYGKVG